jgi:hypothetical protein
MGRVQLSDTTTKRHQYSRHESEQGARHTAALADPNPGGGFDSATRMILVLHNVD